ncbi:AAA family ATPase [Tsukamurella paurometabola]|uniref:AAA family ATPase n=1 Tax=Tsukamurella paurometabola TaxID=2061 RepID=A0ABS5NF71_TSUPA|nr:AAA family ATPase [Tsukamurella paurometabola]MBS4102930.1 AAA family ATPase [Tsukamurella paurometabola]
MAHPTDFAIPHDTPTPTTLETWRPYIPEHIDTTPAPAAGGPCACPTVAGIVLHVAECAQGVGGRAQPYDEATCAEYDLVTNELVDAVTLGAALRGITAQGLTNVMLWEAEDREFVAVLQRDRTPEELEVRAANVAAYRNDSAVREAFDRDEAAREEAESEAEYLFETLRRRMTVEDYDRMFMELDVDDPDSVLSRLRAEVAALPAVASTTPVPPAEPFTVPPAPGAAGPQAPSAPLPPVAPAAPLSTEQQPIADAMRERAVEATHLQLELEAYLTMLPADDAGREVGALMAMTLAERSEAVEAAKAGRLHRLGLRLADLVPSAKGSTRAWLRLREGAAGQWSIEELVPFTKDQLRAKMNGSPRLPTIMQLFYDTSIHLLAGSGGIGKTWIALAACKAVLPPVPIPGHRGPYAVYLDLDQNGDELYQRAGWLGVREEDLLSRRLELMDVSAEAAERGAGTVALLRSILDGLLEAPPRVVVVDSLTRITSDIGADSDNGDAITAVLGMFNDLARVSCVIVLDHTGHGDQTRPKGSGAKKDASHVVHSVEAIPLDPERNPHAVAVGKIHSTKDRFGGIRRINRDPGDRSSLPVLGMISVSFDDSENAASVDFVPQAINAAAKERRDSDNGKAFTAAARKVIRQLVDEAAREAVTAEQAKARGCKPVPPLSARGIEDAAWDKLRDNQLGGRKSDVRDAIRRMTGKDLVEYQANWGSTPGVRYRLAGGITDGHLDPVDLD